MSGVANKRTLKASRKEEKKNVKGKTGQPNEEESDVYIDESGNIFKLCIRLTIYRIRYIH